MTFGAIEAGGTKFVVSIGDGEGAILEQVSFPTTDPEETLARTVAFFKTHGKPDAIGIGSFGPIDVNPNSPTYGFITKTPKPGWSHVNFLGAIKRALPVPLVWTTDVNASAYGEYRRGVGRDLNSLAYVTVGTGIGAGTVVDGRFIGGEGHPEIGHIRVRNHPDDDYRGHCPFHSHCLEGMASGPAIAARTGTTGAAILPEDPFWEIEAYYLAQCALTIRLLLAPERILFGGGVMHQEHLYGRIRLAFEGLMNDYLDLPPLEDYIRAPALGANAATIGCFELAKEATK